MTQSIRPIIAIMPAVVVGTWLGAPALAQSFSCPFGKDPACLDYGDTVCSSQGMCVDQNAACFDKYQCNYEGFTCTSNVTECAEDYDKLLSTHNTLVDDYNELLRTNDTLVDDYNTLLDRANTLQDQLEANRRCVALATTLADASYCLR